MSISRAEVSGAILILNLQEAKDRYAQMEKLLRVSHPDKEVAKIMSDLSSYPEWTRRADLDVVKVEPHEDESGYPAKS